MSKIEWTDETWNPLAGCTPVSEGCRNCYAAGMALRLEAMGQAKYTGTAKRVSDGRAVFTGKIAFGTSEELVKPLGWKKPRRIFVNSMSDLFHEAVPDAWIGKVWSVMLQAHRHTFQVLTKRPQRMAEVVTRLVAEGKQKGLREPDHIWLGTSVEHQAAADERIPHLLRTPARVRFLSCEPLLGPVNLDRWLGLEPGNTWADCLCDEISPEDRPCLTCDSRRWLGQQSGLSWIIVGGESGPKARPMHPAWARSLRDQAQAAGVAFHFKQWGEWLPFGQREPWSFEESEYFQNLKVQRHEFDHPNRRTMYRVGKKAAGRLLDSIEWNEFPQ